MAYITLNRSHYFHNLSLIEKHIGTKEKIAIVLKDNAYGHGLVEMAALSQEFGIRHAVVRTVSEAQEIKSYFDTVLVLADVISAPLPAGIYITVNDLQDLHTIPSQTAIELKVDSGMHRNGLLLEELDAAFDLISSKKLDLKGVFTHHRAADTLSSEYFWQEKKFEQVKHKVQELLKRHQMPPVRFHSQNSGATMRAQQHGDIVRVGIAAYGLLQMPQPLPQLPFKPVLALVAKRLHRFKSKAAFKHGYNGIGRIDSDKELATYDLGYADGLLRLQDDKVFTNSNGVSIIGRVSMDNIITDATQEELILFDDANSYADAAQTIGYEVVVRLAPQLKRQLIN